MMNLKEDEIKAADTLNERGGMLNERQNKVKDLETDSYTFKNKATQVRRSECKKKACYIGIILAFCWL